jgi:hypothetical protein
VVWNALRSSHAVNALLSGSPVVEAQQAAWRLKRGVGSPDAGQDSTVAEQRADC